MNILKIFVSVSIFSILFQSCIHSSIAATTESFKTNSVNQKYISELAPTITGNSRRVVKERASGMLFERKSIPTSGDPSNTMFLIGTEYVGQCPGKSEIESSARFFSRINKPAARSRVFVRNITFGFAGSVKPYTNREYFSGDLSEGFLVKFGDAHNDRYLAVKPGENKFDYIIKQNDIFVSSGEFSVTIDEKISTVKRDAVLAYETTCLEHKDKKCVREITLPQYRCQ